MGELVTQAGGLHQFTFLGVLPRERWSLENLDYLAEHLAEEDLQTVSLVDVAEQSARARLERAGWMRIELQSSRLVDSQNHLEFELSPENGDGEVPTSWRAFASALGRASALRPVPSWLQVFIYPWATGYREDRLRQCQVSTRADGQHQLTIYGYGLRERLTERGKLLASRRNHTTNG